MAALSGGGPKGPASIAAILCALAVFVRTADGSADAVPAPLAAPVTASGAKEGSAYVVETIPYDTDLKLTSGGRHTWEVLVSFLNEAKEKVDFTAMYQNLVNGTQELSPALRKRWGTDKGKLVYDALRNAAKRGVKLRAVCGVGLSGTDELEQIQREFPEQVTFQLFNASMWYGGGIMHMKAWIFDDNRALITSSNTDWKSLTQVKELGVAVDASPGFELVRDLQLYFNRWWLWTTPTTYRSMKRPQRPVYDPYLQQPRVVPCFSLIGTQIPHTPDPPCENPLRSFPSTKYNLANPMFLKLNGTMGRTILTCSPPEVCDTPNAIYSQFTAALEGRTWDGDALVQTILLAREHVSLSVMDFIPSTMYDTTAGAWWPALNDALVSKAAQGLSIRLLISKWANSLPEMESYLHALRDTARAALKASPHRGSFEIRLFEVPGWQHTTGPQDQYPTFSRVNHAKYIVTDNRFNVGTSNMEWSYFHNTAGTSFHSDHPLLRAQVSSVFERDWKSEYAAPLGAAPVHSPLSCPDAQMFV